MLQTLHRIVEEVNSARGLRQALAIIVRRVAEAMNVDVCSVYLIDQETKENVLMATLGLHQDAVGSVRLLPGEGLVGLVGEREEPVNLDNADRHPRFRYFPETGEERFHAFLGVPIIHFRKLLGVLVVQQQAERRFDDAEVAFLVTMASQLSGAIAHAEASGGVEEAPGPGRAKVAMLAGVAGAPGVAIGEALVVYASADLTAVPDRAPENPVQETEGFLTAVEAVRVEVRELAERLAGIVPAEEHFLFDVYLRILESESIIDETVARIHGGNWAPGALRETISKHVKLFTEMEDPYLRERASDIRDIGRRVLMHLQKDAGDKRVVPNRVILLGQEVGASQLAEIPPAQLAGVVSGRGSGSSHVAILARAMGVPAVMGVVDIPLAQLEGKRLIVDGFAGRVLVEPLPAVRREYQRLIKQEAALSAGLRHLRDEPAETLDGHRVKVCVNTGLMSDIGSGLESGCDGIGLHRTEFPFMIRERFPGEEEQTAIYRQVLETYRGLPVVLRTLDVGGDKALPYFPITEENPFLGWRGIRLTLDHPEIFLTQLRAMLRANIGQNNLQIMFPMISRLDEVDQALALLRRAHAELSEEGHSVQLPPIGAMVEVPAAVYQAAALARRVDFLSVGTNDLTQYLLAVDRNNAHVAKLYDEFHPAVLAALWQVAQTAKAVGTPLSICGGMAGDPAGALLLTAMGVDSLSMSAVSLLRVKWAIRSVRQADLQSLLVQVLSLEHAAEIRSALNQTLEQAGLASLVRTGKSE